MSLSIKRSRKTERTAQMTAYFMVRAQVIDPTVKNDFDRRYQDEHLPDALEGFKARRGWSALDASVHGHPGFRCAEAPGGGVRPRVGQQGDAQPRLRRGNPGHR